MMGITGYLVQVAGGAQWNDPLTAFGELSLPVLLSSMIAIFCFFAAGIFIYRYYKKFYAIGQIPKGWKFFFIGLILSGLYQILKIPFTYEWLYGDFFILMFLVFQIAVTGILVYGLYLLKKEVTI